MKPQFMTCARGVVAKNQLIFQILSAALMLFRFAGMTMAADSGLGQDKIRLWYDEPASKWTDALPVGNGRLGAMVFGTVPKERLQLNEESLWPGEPTDAYPEDFSDTIRKVQRLVLEGRTVRRIDTEPISRLALRNNDLARGAPPLTHVRILNG